MITKSSLKFRLVLSIGALALVSSLLVSQFASNLSRRQIEKDESALLLNVATRMSAQLAHDMSTRANEILFLTGSDRIRDPAYPNGKKRELFERMRQAYPFYAWIGLTDTQGNIIAGTDGLLVGKSVAKRDWFLKGREGLHFGDAHDAFLLAKLMPKPKWDDLPLRLVDLSAPVYDEKGNFLGVICGHLSLDWAFEVRESMLDQLSRDTLDLIVLNKEGRVLMGTPQLPSLKLDLSSLKTYQELANNLHRVAVDKWPDGRSYLTAMVRETPFRNYSGMGWTVVARKAEEAAFAPAAELSRLLLLAGLAMAVAFSGVLWIMLKRTLRPLEEISEAARRIRDEDMSAPIPQPRGDDEVASFARSLTSLVGGLQEKNDELRLTGRVFDESGQGILISDADNRILRVNRAFTRITGYTQEEVKGSTPAILQSGRQNDGFYESMWNGIKRYGSWQGEIWNRAKNGNVYPEWLTINTLADASGAISHYIAIFDDITEKKDYERRLVHLANYDSLTDLPNRHLMEQEVVDMLARAAREGTELALMFVDLDKFKHINDILGHPAGDQVLKEVASRFKAHIGKSELLARWGGDEFVVVLPGCDSMAAAHLAQQLTEALERPFGLAGGSYHVSMSVGIAMYPADGENVDALLRCADTAMYRAKKDGMNLYRFYESSMNAGVERFLKIDNALRHSLDQGGAGLSLAFQPQYEGARVVGAEALLRWTHPELGEIPPGQFIPVAEDTGQIVRLGQWVMDAAGSAYATLAGSGCRLPLSINCSAHQLRQNGLVRSLQDVCRQYGVPAADLILEVTESAIMSDEVRSMETLTDLRSLGYCISIDDFGTGYSCLNYLQKIRPAEIKIDQSFVARMLDDEDSRNIVSFTLNLAGSMSMAVVAEGVETEEQRQALLALGGNLRLQGFLTGRPMPLESLIQVLKAADARDA